MFKGNVVLITLQELLLQHTEYNYKIWEKKNQNNTVLELLKTRHFIKTKEAKKILKKPTRMQGALLTSLKQFYMFL